MTTSRAVLLALPVVALGWIGMLLLVMRLAGAPAALVPFPPPGLLAQLPEGVAIADATRHSVTLRSDAPDFVAMLYRLGAPLVLPAGLPACLPAPDQPRAP